MSGNLIRKVLDQAGFEDCGLCLTGHMKAEYLEKPLFFYHIHKTGGNSIKAAFNTALTTDDRTEKLGFKPGDHYDTRDLHADPGEPLHPRPAFVSSHYKFGHHLRFEQEFCLLTVVREPVERTISDYHFLRWRQGIEPSEDDFAAFIRNPRNICLQAQHLSSLDINDAGPEDIYADAVNNLESFAAYATTNDIEPLLQSIWDACGLINMVTSKMNENARKKIKYFDTSKFADEISELNEMDLRLYRHIRDNPRYMEGVRETDAISHVIGIAYDPKEDAALNAVGKVMLSEEFIEPVQAGTAKRIADFFD